MTKNVLKPVQVLLCRETFPGFAVVDKETSLIDDLEGDANDLFEVVGSVTGGGIVTAIFDPVKKGFNQLVYIIKGCGRQHRIPDDPWSRCWCIWITSDPGCHGWW